MKNIYSLPILKINQQTINVRKRMMAGFKNIKISIWHIGWLNLNPLSTVGIS
jgi:hypothetical protein